MEELIVAVELNSLNYPIAPCPCCGTEATFQQVPYNGTPQAGGTYIECGNIRCGLSSILIRLGSVEETRLKLLERWNRRVPIDGEPAMPPPMPLQFPRVLRKMWSGEEVQRWIDANWAKP